MSEELDQKVFNYIATLEKSNEELFKTLKKCVDLLTEFKSSVPDPKSWQEMLDVFQEMIFVRKRLCQKTSIKQVRLADNLSLEREAAYRRTA